MGTESTTGGGVGGDDKVLSEKSLSAPVIENSAKPPKQPFSKKRLLLKIGFSAAVFLLCIVVAETTSHLMGYGNLEVYDPDPGVYWRLTPNQNCFTKVNHQPVRINSLGTRGPEFQRAKPPQTIRILSVGDSRTFGWGLAENETYSARLGHLLQEKLGAARRVEVINAGVNGWGYEQMFVYFRDVGMGFHPDVVIVGEGNGWTQFSEKSSPDFKRGFIWRVRLKNVLRRSAIYHYAIELKLKNFYEQHRAKFIPIDPNQDPYFKGQQRKEPQEIFRAAIEELCGLAASNHVQPVLLYLPVVPDLSATNRSAILRTKQAVAQKLNIPFVDPRASLSAAGASLYLEGDLTHLNAEGNRILAEALFSVVTNVVGMGNR
jgi:lysophospholipase L1-like esterase